MSYARFDNEQYDGQISDFRRLLSAEVKAQTGQEFEIFEDREHISWGQNWQEVIDQALDTVALLLVIITPGYFRSEACRAEVTRFSQRERDLGRSDLILPVYYITAKEIEDPAARRADEVASMLASRQFVDWRDLRLEPVDAPVVRKAVAQLASRMRTAFWQTPREQPRPVGGNERAAGPAIAAGPLAGLEYERRAWQAGQPVQGAVAPSDAWPPSPASTAPAFLPKWDGPAAQLSPEAQRPQAPGGAPYPGGGAGARPAAQPSQRVLAFPPNRRTALAAGALAALLAAGGIFYAIAAHGSGHAGPQAGSQTGSAAAPKANLAETLTVPGGGNSTVDTVWISPDGTRIAAARTGEASSIYVWNTASPGSPTTLTVPPMEVGGTAYPTMIENIAFSADDAAMTMIGYPASSGAASGQSYVLYRWDLANGSHATPWSITGTPSNISFSNDNSTAVESGNGGASLLTLLPQPTDPAPLVIPGGSGLHDNTSFYLDLNGKRMLYSPKRGTWNVWDFTEGKTVDTWSSEGYSYLSPDGKTALVYYGSKESTIVPPPILVDLATRANVTPTDPRWQQQLVSSKTADAYVTYSTDGAVITTERAGGKTDLWSAETHKFLLTIADPNYRADSDYAVVSPHGSEVVIFGQEIGSSGHQFHRLYVWNTGLGS
jgi:WD40 repeat protein